ncbi:MAG: hypothetical protein V1787_00645 [Candidatus Micrarchaeota archaeon]
MGERIRSWRDSRKADPELMGDPFVSDLALNGFKLSDLHLIPLSPRAERNFSRFARPIARRWQEHIREIKPLESPKSFLLDCLLRAHAFGVKVQGDRRVSQKPFEGEDRRSGLRAHALARKLAPSISARNPADLNRAMEFAFRMGYNYQAERRGVGFRL